MVHLHCNGKLETPARFLKKRIIRIYPVYWLSVIACVAIAIVCSMIDFTGWKPLQEIGATSWFATFSLLPIGKVFLINHVTWSLIYEIWYYLMFAVLLRYMKENFIIGVMMYGAAIIVVNSLFTLKGVIIFGLNLSMPLSTLNLFFVVGSMIGYLYTEKDKRYAKLAVLTLAACFVAQVFLGWRETVNAEAAGLLTEFFLLSVSIAIIVGLLYAERVGVIMPKFLVYIGNMSYTLYLFHFILVLVYRGIFQLIFPNVYQYGAVEIATSYVFIFVVCWMIYEKAEKPMTERLRQQFLKKNMH